MNVDLSCEPSVFTTVMIATEMPAAIRPYSIAVAPEFVFRKARHEACHFVLLYPRDLCLTPVPAGAVCSLRSSEPVGNLGRGHCRRVNFVVRSFRTLTGG